MKLRSSFLVLFVLLVLFRYISCQSEWKAQDVPNPTINFAECGNGQEKRWICDSNHYLTDNEKSQLQEQLTNIFESEKTICDQQEYGYQIGILIIDSVYQSKLNIETSVQDLAIDVFNSWGLGYENCQTGVLIVLSIKDRYTYTRTGAKSMEILTNTKIDIIRSTTMKKYLKEGNYYKALSDTLQEYKYVFQSKTLYNYMFHSSRSNYIYYMGILIFILVIIIGIIVGCIFVCIQISNDNKEKECEKKLKQLQEQISNSKAKQYQQTTCPICLENLPQLIVFVKDINKEMIGTTATQLLCGHKFCTLCLKKILKNNCPICREPLFDDDQKEKVKQGTQYQMSQDEYVFRLSSIQMRHPTVFSNQTFHQLVSEPCHTQTNLTSRFSFKYSQRQQKSVGNFGGGHTSHSSSHHSGGSGSGGHW